VQLPGVGEGGGGVGEGGGGVGDGGGGVGGVGVGDDSHVGGLPAHTPLLQSHLCPHGQPSPNGFVVHDP